MIMIEINGQTVDRFSADGQGWQGTLQFQDREANELRIYHYGKNYITDQCPDKFFELQRAWINGVDLKHNLHRFQQVAFLPPWDTDPPPAHSLYLGHNGYLALSFQMPINAWLKTIFGVDQQTMHGQHTTRTVLDDVKSSFGF